MTWQAKFFEFCQGFAFWLRLMGERSRSQDANLEPGATDNQLARLAAKGDGDAFRALLERHYDAIFRIAYRFCGHREEAEDIAQDVCVSLPKRLKGYRGDSRFSTWLYRVVINRAKDVRRSQSSTRDLHNDFGEIEELRRGEEALKNRELRWLNDAMARLSDDLRETALLVVGEALSHAQAGEVLGLSEGTVSWRMSELKKALREIASEEA